MMWDNSIVDFFENQKVILCVGGGEINLEKFRKVNVVGMMGGGKIYRKYRSMIVIFS